MFSHLYWDLSFHSDFSLDHNRDQRKEVNEDLGREAIR